MKQKILLFDIDGTLLLTGGAGSRAINDTFLKLYGIRNAWGNTQPHGRTDFMIFEEIIRRVLKKKIAGKEKTEIFKTYERSFKFQINRDPGFRLMPGAAQTLEILRRQKKFFLAIQTGNFKRVSMMKLKRGEIRHYFKTGGYGCDAAAREKIIAKALSRSFKLLGRPIPRENIFVIGDAPQDILAGKALRLKTIGVLTGRARSKDLLPCRPDHIFENLTNTDKLLKILA